MPFKLVHGFEQTVSTEKHNALLLSKRPGPARYKSSRTTPIASVQFKDLNLKSINECYKSKDLVDLRNYLVWKKKGKGREQNALSLYVDNTAELGSRSTPTPHGRRPLVYSFTVDENLLQTLEKSLKHPYIFARVTISYVEEQGRSRIKRINIDRIFQIDRKPGKPGKKISKILGSPTKRKIYMNSEFIPKILNGRIFCLNDLQRMWNGELKYTIDFKIYHKGRKVQNEGVRRVVKIESSSILKRLYNLEASTKDVSMITTNGVEVKCHKVVLMAQSEEFRLMFSTDTNEAQTGIIQMPENIQDAVEEFIKFLYGFHVPSDEGVPQLALEISLLAHKYDVRAQQAGGGSIKIMCSDAVLQNMYNLETSTKEVSIIAANGAEVKCHKIILLAQSAEFHSMFSHDTMEAQTGIIQMPENSQEGLEQFIRFLYGFEISLENDSTMTPDMVVELFQLSHKYGVNVLEKSLKEFICRKDMTWFTPDTILELYFYSRNIESLDKLKIHAMSEMSTMTEDALKNCDYFLKLRAEDSLSLVLKLQEWNN